MAGYSATINLRVTGGNTLEGVITRTRQLQNIVESINKTKLDLSKPFGRGKAADEFNKAAKALNDVKRAFVNSDKAVETFGSTSNRSLANVRALSGAFDTLADNVAMGTNQFREFTVASQQAQAAAGTAVRSQLDILREEMSFGGKQGKTIGGGSLVKELLAQEKQIPRSIAALQSYRADLLKVRNLVDLTSNEFIELEQAIRRVEIASGTGPVQGPEAPKTPKGGGAAKGSGMAGFLTQASGFGLGAGFPLLFGGGVGQVAGGVMGTAVAQAFGLAGEAAMGLQIALSAVAGKVEELVTRFREIGNATRVLDLDALEQSSITVNAELRQLVRHLVEAGESGAALSAVTAKVAEQTGIIPSKTADITRSVNKLSNEWDGTISAVSGLVSILSQPFVNALTQILRLVNQTTKGANVLLQLLSEGLNLLNPFHPLLKLLNKDTEDIVESEQKRLDLLRQSSDKLELEYNRNKALFDIESKRTAGKTAGEKLINAELERNKKLKELEFATDDKIKQNRREYGDLTSKQAQIELNYSEMLIEKNAEIEKQKINQTYELEKQNIQYAEMQNKLKDITEKGEAQKRNIQAQESAYRNSMNVVGARLEAESAVNDLHNQQLERAYEIAGTSKQRLEIAKEIYQNEIKGAELVYQKTINQIEAEQKALEFKRQSAVIDAQVLKARGDMLIAERKGDEATRARVRESLNAQAEVIRLIDNQIVAQGQIAGYQKEAADAQFRAAELTARQNLEQKLVSDEIGLSQQEAYNLSGRLSDGSINAHNLKTGMGLVKSNTQQTVTMMIRVATEADRAANSIARAAAQQQALNAARAQSSGGGSSSPPAYAKGGFVNGAQMALIGEGGPEYIVPEKKAAAFATNYLMGARGSAAIPRYAEGGYVGSVSIQTGPVTQMDGTNYVTTGDLSMAVQAGIRQTLDLIRRDGNTRASLGLS